MEVRAGILNGLLNQDTKSIHNATIMDVLYINKMLKTVIEFSYYIFLRSQYQPGNVPDRSDFFTGNNIFKTCYDKIIDRFINDGYTCDEIMSMIVTFSDIKELCTSDQIVIDKWQNISGRTGVLYEAVAISNLKKMGFDIGTCESRSVILNESGLKLNLNGRPDGVILSSPGDAVPAGTILEVKYKPHKRCDRTRDELQLCAYGLIFGVDVFYVIIYDNNNMECNLIKHEQLLQIWQEKKENIINNCKYLNHLMNTFETSESSMVELIDLAR